MSGLRAARDLNHGTGEPSPDVLFSRRPSRKGSAAAIVVLPPPQKKKKKKKEEEEEEGEAKATPAPVLAQKTTTSKAKPAPRSSSKSNKSSETATPETSSSPTPPAAPTTPRSSSDAAAAATNTTTDAADAADAAALAPSSPPAKPTKTAAAAAVAAVSCPACALRSDAAASSDAAKDQQVRALTATVTSLRGEMQAQRTEHSALLSTLRGDLQTAQDEVLKMVQLGRDQQRRFDVEQVAWRAREQQLVEAGTATLTREKELEDKMLSFKTGCDEANQKAVSLEALYAKLVEECEASRAEAVALRSECREQRTRGDHSEAQLLSLQEELARARTDHTQMQTSLVTQEALREAEATAREAGALAAEAETTVASLQQELSRVQGRLATAEALPHRLRDEIRRATEGNVKQVERVEAEMSQLRELLREEAGKTTMLQEERDALSKRVGVMQDQVRQLTMDAKGMNAAEFEDTFEAVMREEFDAMRNAYEGKLKALQADASKQRNAHDKSVRDVQKELRSKMVTLRTDVMRRDATIAQMRKEIEDLKK